MTTPTVERVKIPSLILNADARKIGKEKQNQEEKEAVWWLSCTAGIKNKDPINSPETTEHQGRRPARISVHFHKRRSASG